MVNGIGNVEQLEGNSRLEANMKANNRDVERMGTIESRRRPRHNRQTSSKRGASSGRRASNLKGKEGTKAKSSRIGREKKDNKKSQWARLDNWMLGWTLDYDPSEWTDGRTPLHTRHQRTMACVSLTQRLGRQGKARQGMACRLTVRRECSCRRANRLRSGPHLASLLV